MSASTTPRPRRSVLCVPATDPRRIAKALASGADEVVVDLEDAVAAKDKASARAVLSDLDWAGLPRPGRLAVRVNGPRTPWCHRDLEVVVGLPVDSVVLPKVEGRADLGFAERLLDGLEAEAGRAGRLTLQALVETAAGLTRLEDTVSDLDRLDSLIIGYADLAASLGRRAGRPGSWFATEERVLWAARSTGLEAVDGPHLGVQDDGDFRDEVEGAAALGFDGKWAIHPRQVPAITEAFTPSEAEVVQARRVLDALEAGAGQGKGAVALDGALLDEAMAVAARRVLAKVTS